MAKKELTVDEEDAVGSVLLPVRLLQPEHRGEAAHLGEVGRHRPVLLHPQRRATHLGRVVSEEPNFC